MWLRRTGFGGGGWSWKRAEEEADLVGGRMLWWKLDTRSESSGCGGGEELMRRRVRMTPEGGRLASGARLWVCLGWPLFLRQAGRFRVVKRPSSCFG